jgi:hypothetical protein
MAEYCTVAEVKYLIGDNLQANTNNDTILTSLITQARSVIDSYCGGKPPRIRTFEASGDSTRMFNALDPIGRTLYLHDDLATTPSTVSDSTGTLTLNTDYILLSDYTPPRAPYSRIKLLTRDWTYSTYPDNAITVTGKFAYSTTPPNDIKLACIELVTVAYRQRDTVAGVFASMTGENGAVIHPDGTAKRVIDKLEPYVWR